MFVFFPPLPDKHKCRISSAEAVVSVMDSTSSIGQNKTLIKLRCASQKRHRDDAPSYKKTARGLSHISSFQQPAAVADALNANLHTNLQPR